MATELEKDLFQEELETIRELIEAEGWQIERDDSVPLGVYIVMHPKSAPEEKFKARIFWTDYFGAPSLKFVNLATNGEEPKAWPRCFGFRPGSMDACLPWTAQGQQLHPEWKSSVKNSFPKVELPLRFVFLQLRHSMNTTYQGRG